MRRAERLTSAPTRRATRTSQTSLFPFLAHEKVARSAAARRRRSARRVGSKPSSPRRPHTLGMAGNDDLSATVSTADPRLRFGKRRRVPARLQTRTVLPFGSSTRGDESDDEVVQATCSLPVRPIAPQLFKVATHQRLSAARWRRCAPSAHRRRARPHFWRRSCAGPSRGARRARLPRFAPSAAARPASAASLRAARLPRSPPLRSAGGARRARAPRNSEAAERIAARGR